MAQTLAGQGAHQASCGHIDEMVVSSNHNESSPDTVGIYGAPPDPTGTFGLNSGIDEYYMDWLDEQIANAAVEACDDRRAGFAAGGRVSRSRPTWSRRSRAGSRPPTTSATRRRSTTRCACSRRATRTATRSSR